MLFLKVFCVLMIIGVLPVNSAPPFKCAEMKVDCLCGDPPNEKIKTITGHGKMPPEKMMMNCSESPTAAEICASYSCKIFSFASPVSKVPDNTNGTVVKKSLHPIKFLLLPEDGTKDLTAHGRFRRFPKTCNDTLKPLDNAQITCWVWPNFLNCEISCTHGYAIQEDGKVTLSTKRTCRESDSYWSPKMTFPVCEPYINCKVILITPGEMHCKSSMVVPSYCDISCLPYEDHKEIPKKRYECIDGNFAKTLPHCASIDESATLIKIPK